VKNLLKNVLYISCKFICFDYEISQIFVTFKRNIIESVVHSKLLSIYPQADG